MKRLLIILIILFSILIILLFVDIFTGIWYHNRLELIFDPTNFNNIITPITGLIAIILYALALNYAIKQNKIIQSQNIRPFFERELIRLQYSIQSFNFEINPSLKKFGQPNGLNYIRIMSNILLEVINDKQFNEDLNGYRAGQRQERKYFYSRSYHDGAFFISSLFHVRHGLFFFYDEVKKVVDELISSNLTNDDKKYLIRFVKKEIFLGYISFWKDIMARPNFYPEVPELIIAKTVEFKKFQDTVFREYYDWINSLKI